MSDCTFGLHLCAKPYLTAIACVVEELRRALMPLQLDTLGLSDNRLTGMLPASWGNLSNVGFSALLM